MRSEANCLVLCFITASVEIYLRDRNSQLKKNKLLRNHLLALLGKVFFFSFRLCLMNLTIYYSIDILWLCQDSSGFNGGQDFINFTFNIFCNFAIASSTDPLGNVLTLCT